MSETIYKTFIWILLILISGAALSYPNLLRAETRYVNDLLIISLRTGPGKNFKIIKTLKTGTPMEVLQEKKEFIKVKTQSGEVGWVPKYYTGTETPKAVVIEDLRGQLTKKSKLLKEKEEALRTADSRWETDRKDMEEQISALSALKEENSVKISELARELETLRASHKELVSKSAAIIKTTEERDRLARENRSCKKQLTEMREKNNSLKSYKQIYWFLAGGALLLFGMLLGRISAGKRQSRKLSL